MATWIDWFVGGLVILIGLGIFYKALKEPLDMVFGWVGGIFRFILDRIQGTSESAYDVIEYG